jgi:hypothetical protein
MYLEKSGKKLLSRETLKSTKKRRWWVSILLTYLNHNQTYQLASQPKGPPMSSLLAPFSEAISHEGTLD